MEYDFLHDLYGFADIITDIAVGQKTNTSQKLGLTKNIHYMVVREINV